VVTLAIEIEHVFRELEETPYGPMKEEHDEIMSRESTTNCQLHVLNEIFINFSRKELMARLDPIQLFLLTLTTIVNYAGQENICFSMP
jgi:hypothetical protein